MTVMRKWSLLAAVLVLAVLAAGWFLAISPKRGDAAALKVKAQQQQSANATLQTQIAQLKEEAKDLPKLQAKLALIRVQLPSDPQLPRLLRDFSGLAKTSGVTIQALEPSEPTALTPAATSATPTATGTSTGTTAKTGTSATLGAASATPSLYQVPLQIKVTGSYYELEQFLNGVEGLRRPFLSTGVDITTATGSGGSSGSSTLSAGDLTLTLNGRVFVAPPVTTTSAAATAAPTSK